MIEPDKAKNKKTDITKDNPHSQDKAVSSLKVKTINNIIKADDIERAEPGKVITYSNQSPLDSVEKVVKAKDFGKEKTFVFGEHIKDNGNSKANYQAIGDMAVISPLEEADITISSADTTQNSKIDKIKDYLASVSQASKRSMITNALNYEHDIIEKVAHVNDSHLKKTPKHERSR